MAKSRKADRRSLYTKQAIKKAFLKLKEKKDYNSITISDICRIAEISRSTFYLHYNHTAEVLDEVLDDAASNITDLMEHLSVAENDPISRCTYPLCKFIRENDDYRCIFFDDSLTGRIIKRLSGIYMRRFAVSKQFAGLDEGEWCLVQHVIDQFIKNGLNGFSEQIS